jgi:DNA modification methylase
MNHAAPMARGSNTGIFHRDLNLTIRQVPVGDIKPYVRNPRSHSRTQIETLKDSLRRFGMVWPILLDADGTVVAGHARLEAAMALGYTHVPVLDLQHLTPLEVKAFRLVDNKSAESATWNEEALALEFKDLINADLKLEIDFDLSITGFSSAEIDRVVERFDGAKDDERDESAPDVSAELPVSRIGDVWDLGEHRLLCGNSLDEASYHTLLQGKLAAVGIHDFPYNVPIKGHVTGSGHHREFVMASGEMSKPQFTTFLTGGLERTRAACIPGALQYAFMDWRHMDELQSAAAEAGLTLKNVCVWDKGAAGMGSFYRSQHELVFVFKDPNGPHQNNIQLGMHGRNRSNVWSYPGGAAAMRKELELHSTPKPVALVADIIRDCTSRNDLVLDAFSGSGTTIIAAAKTGRRARVIDLDPHYVDVAVARWEKWSGRKARHAATGRSFAETKMDRAVPAVQPTASPQIRVRTRLLPSG